MITLCTICFKVKKVDSLSTECFNKSFFLISVRKKAESFSYTILKDLSLWARYSMLSVSFNYNFKFHIPELQTSDPKHNCPNLTQCFVMVQVCERSGPHNSAQRNLLCVLQDDRKVSVHLTQCIRTVHTQLMISRWPSQNTFGMWTVLYWTRSSRTQFEVSVNVWRLAGDTLNITCNFLCCNHQVHRLFDHPVLRIVINRPTQKHTHFRVLHLSLSLRHIGIAQSV